MNSDETRGREKVSRAIAGLVLAASIGLVVSGQLEVVDHGVGRDVVDRELVDAGTEFEVGVKVWFWNRIRGGARGDRIRHVWLRDGEESLSVELELGGPAWRTWSNKTLHPGSEGEWAVEVRGPDGAVLARQEFRCR
jgi:hypothetical protein